MRQCFDNSHSLNAQHYQRVFVLYGLGGSGKTQLALKFLELDKLQYRLFVFNIITAQICRLIPLHKRFNRVYFVDATSLNSLESSFQSIASSIGLGNATSVASTLIWFCTHIEPWLLLFDN